MGYCLLYQTYLFTIIFPTLMALEKDYKTHPNTLKYYILSVMLKNLVVSNSKNYFIYFNTHFTIHLTSKVLNFVTTHSLFFFYSCKLQERPSPTITGKPLSSQLSRPGKKTKKNKTRRLQFSNNPQPTVTITTRF